MPGIVPSNAPRSPTPLPQWGEGLSPTLFPHTRKALSGPPNASPAGFLLLHQAPLREPRLDHLGNLI